MQSRPLFLALVLMSLAGCSSAPGAGSSASFACMMQLTGEAPQCQLYEALDPASESALVQLRAGCASSSGVDTASIVETCPTAGGLGGCKIAVPVEGAGASSIHVDETTFSYASDAGIFGVRTAADVRQQCAEQSGTFVPAP